ncbi:MAG: DUF5103 domain-containing protein [Bacteroidia bacterium]|nr:DUF5103 domain-containing protein [Bacteroidia bacterium]
MSKSIFHTFLVIHLICWGHMVKAADTTMVYDNFIYEKDIRSVKLSQAESGFNFPIITLSGNDQLLLTFDQIKSEMDYFQYTLIHCNAAWEPSNLQKTQYIEGLGFENFPNPEFSVGTLMQYVHYGITVPSTGVKPKISGNYLLVVYRNYDEKDIVITRRIMVLDAKGNLEINLLQSSQVDLRATHQELDFNFNLTSSYNIPNPYTDIKTVLIQNADWNSAISNLKPQFITGSSYNYQYQTGNQFEGLNEYRFFDIRSFRMSTANVKQRFNVSNQKHIILVADQTRRFDKYMNWSDYNGRYLVDNKDMPLPGGATSESDYCFVHFNLRSSEELKNKKVYIYGELTDWAINSDFELYYNPDGGTYEAVVPLKQAYYNYSYVVVDEETGEKDFAYFEGSHATTENNYMVLVYHKNQNLAYDELIGYGLKNSVVK